MRVLILSDIHGNLEALKRVLEISEGVDNIWVLGDTVGYGPNPAECLALVREKADIILSGNHDMAVSGQLPYNSFNPQAAQAVRYTEKMLDEEALQFMRQLSPIRVGKNITLVHGSPTGPAVDYLLSERAVQAAAAMLTTEVCFFGHTHVAGCFYRKGSRFIWKSLENGEEVPLGREYVFYNPGSIGQPRDNDPRASYALADTEKMTWTLNRTEYDIEAVQNKMEALGSPQFLIHRLSKGI